MAFEMMKRSDLYERIVRPLVWAPIFAHRRYQEMKRARLFERLAIEDGKLLAHVRAQKEHEYLGERSPLVSITTPTYNRGQLVAESTMPAVLAQTYANFEWLIVGDHCTDDTVERMAAVKDPRVSFCNLPTRPQYPKNKRKRWMIVGTKANNLAHQMAKGSWISHLDDDDVYTPDHIEQLLACALAGNLEFVWGRSRVELRPGEWEERGAACSADGKAPGYVSHSTVLYRKYLDQVFPYDPHTPLKLNMGGDAFRWRRMVNAGVRVGFVDRVVTFIPLRPGEAVRTISLLD